MEQAVWYLGLDFDATGLAAVLLNQISGEQYPLYWSFPALGTPEFRLPGAVYYGMGETQSHSPFFVGNEARQKADRQQGIFFEHFVPYLQIALPHYSSYQRQWEPQIEGYDQHPISIYWIQRACQALLETLTPSRVQVPGVKENPNAYSIGAINCSPATLKMALNNLEGVVLSCPMGWQEPYRFNLREAVLGAKLVQSPNRIFIVEDAVASLLGCLPIPRKQSRKKKIQENPAIDLSLKSVPTLVIHLGKFSTELAVVDLPDPLEGLSYENIAFYSIPYGENAIDQDIFCQMLYPQWVTHQPLLELIGGSLPQPGAIETYKRSRLNSFFQASAARRSLGAIPRLVRQILSEQTEFSSQLHQNLWTVKRRDLERKVIFPWIDIFNQQLNQFFLETSHSQPAIIQVICSGEILLSFWFILEKWLRSKFGSATFIFPDSSYPFHHLATGLARFPFFPQVLNVSHHQYSDYFLLSELLKLPFSQPLSWSQIINLLEHRGINTQVCSPRLQNIVDGQLPLGLIPNGEVYPYLCESSQANRLYQDLNAAPVFTQTETGLYECDVIQQEILSQYLATILLGTVQKFDEPYS